jgi:hypothetical protein
MDVIGTITVSIEDYARDLVQAYIAGVESVKEVVKSIPCNEEEMLGHFRGKLLEHKKEQETCGSI